MKLVANILAYSEDTKQGETEINSRDHTREVTSTPPTGYRHESYARALSTELGPIHLPQANGWLICDSIRDSNLVDARAPYPLLCCGQWEALADDLELLTERLVTVTAVTDPFAGTDCRTLSRAFPSLVQPFKTHFVIDLQNLQIGAHHRRNIRRSTVTACKVDDLAGAAQQWCQLYTQLIKKRQIRGVAAFSAASLTEQLSVPGLVAFVATSEDETVAMQLWLVDGDHAYYHLGAANEAGYATRASYALFALAIEHFTNLSLCWLDLGGSAGLVNNPSDGLARFKSGWASTELPVYLCGRVCNPGTYAELSRQHAKTGYFPAYRARDLQASS